MESYTFVTDMMNKQGSWEGSEITFIFPAPVPVNLFSGKCSFPALAGNVRQSHDLSVSPKSPKII